MEGGIFLAIIGGWELVVFMYFGNMEKIKGKVNFRQNLKLLLPYLLREWKSSEIENVK